jgi:hypothetical protein
MEKANKTPTQPGNIVCRDQLVTLGDLQEFKGDLLISIKAIVQNSNPQSVRKWLKSYEVRKLFNISKGTLQSFRSNGTLPYVKMGGLIYYDAEEINKVLAEKKHDFADETAPSAKKTNLLKKN